MMWEEDELPEGDLRSVYGEDAAHRRVMATIERLERKYDETVRQIEGLRVDRDPYAAWFLYRQGAVVRYAGAPDTPFTISQRRWTQRDVLGPTIEYLLWPQDLAGEYPGWVYEPDVTPWPDPDEISP